jgi:secreted trypsin-like serine protease
MKKVSVLAILVVILAAGALPAAAITGGQLDGDGHPNVGLMIAEEDGEPAWRCSGTLITPRVFLTAGHCVDGATAARVWFDSDMADVPDYPYGGEVAIEGTPIPHPDFGSSDSDPHDVGLVILDQAVTDIEPAMMPEPDLLAQLKKDRVLQEGGPEESEYVALTKVWLHLSQKAVFDESGTCFGDSGGPSFWIDSSGNEIIVAVTSTGDAQCVATGLNYRVDTPETIGWINEVIGDLE